MTIVTASPSDSLRLELIVPPEVRAGGAVPITVRLTNTSGRTLDLYLRGRTIAFDIIVAREDGQVVWRRLEGEIIPAIVQVVTLAPGEGTELRAEWQQRTNVGDAVEPGRYTVTGQVLTDGEPLETSPQPLQILPS